MEEMKRAQELRVDKLSLQKLRESHDTLQRLTSQIQELQEKVNCMNESGEFQGVESRIKVEKHFSRSLSTSCYSTSTFYAKLRQTLAT